WVRPLRGQTPGWVRTGSDPSLGPRPGSKGVGQTLAVLATPVARPARTAGVRPLAGCERGLTPALGRDLALKAWVRPLAFWPRPWRDRRELQGSDPWLGANGG